MWPAIEQILQNNAPVLCLDTCALLDIMRDPTRMTFSQQNMRAALNILDKAEENPAAHTVLISNQVLEEANRHLDEIQRECQNALTKHDDITAHTTNLMAELDPSITQCPYRLDSFDYPQNTRRIVERFIAAAAIAAETNEQIIRAFQRSAAKRPPATRGASSGDCIIVETYLEVSRMCRSVNFDHKIQFLTTNTKDFCQSRLTLHTDLQFEFDAERLEPHFNFASCYYSL